MSIEDDQEAFTCADKLEKQIDEGDILDVRKARRMLAIFRRKMEELITTRHLYNKATAEIRLAREHDKLL